MSALPFHTPYRHGFARVAVAIPSLQVADPAHNAEATLAHAQRASDRGATLVVFPELGITGYSCDDLFHQSALIEAAEHQVEGLIAASEDLTPVIVVGAPLRREGRLFNCAFVLHRGALLGVVPKSYLPTYREYYEKRYFAADENRLDGWVEVAGQEVPFGSELLFEADNLPGFRLHVEICEDLWAPISPSSWGALAGANLLANASASNVTIDKASFRRLLAQAQSGKNVAAYVYAGAGYGESTTDLAWDGHGMICENGELLAETERFAADGRAEGPLIVADVDLERLDQDRLRLSSFQDNVRRERSRLERFTRVAFTLGLPEEELPLEREVERFPYVPAEEHARDDRCEEAYRIQVHGLVKRLQATGIEKLVIGVSGGLDSTHALIVARRATELLGLPAENVRAYTMPGFATSDRTLENARALMAALGVTASEIDIRPSCRQMLADIGHPHTDENPVYDVTFENVQAGERTSHLFRLANLHGALVVGTGDLSELALGWCTYGVGDQMSHYNVNGSVPKTLIQHLIRWVADRELFGAEASETLRGILATEISPELVPAGGSGEVQSTEAVIGPYELQDFHLYYTTRFGFRPSKVAYLAHCAWADPQRGAWPAGLPAVERRAYDLGQIKRWLAVFLRRFFESSQFKRSALPNGPKVGSGGSLSPRGDWRAPSDSNAAAWLAELDENVPVDESGS